MSVYIYKHIHNDITLKKASKKQIVRDFNIIDIVYKEMDNHCNDKSKQPNQIQSTQNSQQVENKSQSYFSFVTNRLFQIRNR